MTADHQAFEFLLLDRDSVHDLLYLLSAVSNPILYLFLAFTYISQFSFQFIFLYLWNSLIITFLNLLISFVHQWESYGLIVTILFGIHDLATKRNLLIHTEQVWSTSSLLKHSSKCVSFKFCLNLSKSASL